MESGSFMALIRSFLNTFRKHESTSADSQTLHRLQQRLLNVLLVALFHPLNITDFCESISHLLPRRQELTSAGFFGLEAGVPGLLPFLLEEQNEVEGPEQGQIGTNLIAEKVDKERLVLTRLTFIVGSVTAARGPEPFHPGTSCTRPEQYN